MIQRAKYDIEGMKAGEDDTITLGFKDSNGAYRDLTGWAARCQFRESPHGAVKLTLSTTDGTIINGGVTGKLTLVFGADATKDLARNLIYDVFVTLPDTTVKCVLEGRATFEPRVTR